MCDEWNSLICVGVVGFMQEGIKGIDEPFFGKKFHDNAPGAGSKRMAEVTKTTCQITKDIDGHWIGDCENCFKRLGYSCPGANWVRSKHGQLQEKLSHRQMVPANSAGNPLKRGNRGNKSKLYRRGPSSRKARASARSWSSRARRSVR